MRKLVLLAFALGTVASPSPLAAEEPEESSEPLLVLAASSLTGPMQRIGERWETGRNTGVTFSFGGSSRLATQLVQGAEADVFLSADPKWVDHLERKDLLVDGTRRPFASNRLVWVVPKGSSDAPEDLASVADRPPDKLALGGPNVPAGNYARSALRSGGVWSALEGRVVSAENVKRALQWVASGEAPAGIVYATDARASNDVEVAFTLPERLHPAIVYEGAVPESSDHPEVAEEFLAFLIDGSGRDELRRAGFSAPPSAEHASQQRAESSPPTAETVDQWSAVGLSVSIGVACVVGGLVPAVLLGWLLARRRFWGKSLVATLLLSPLALPPVVTGFILLRLFGRTGPLGDLLATVGLEFSFTTLGAALAAFVVAFPLYLLTARSAFSLVDRRYEEVAMTLGDSPSKTFWRVTIPLALPGLAAGALLTFARALGEFGATIVLAGNVSGETQTIPLAIYTLLESPSGYDAIWWLVGVSLGLSLLAVLGFEWFNRRQREQLDAH